MQSLTGDRWRTIREKSGHPSIQGEEQRTTIREKSNHVPIQGEEQRTPYTEKSGHAPIEGIQTTQLILLTKN